MRPYILEASIVQSSGEALERGDSVDVVDAVHEILDLVCCGLVDSVIQPHDELFRDESDTGSRGLVERCQRRDRGWNCRGKCEDSVEVHGWRDW